MRRPLAAFSLLGVLVCSRASTAPLVARLETELGQLRILLLPEYAPRHVENFQKLVEGTLYDGSTFHRVIPGYLIQGGSPTSRDNDPNNDNLGTGGYGLVLETTELRHVRGAVAMARDVSIDRDAAQSSGAQFFIVLGDAPMLDEIGFTIFGRVIEGMEVADRIASVGRDEANYDRPLRPVKIVRLVMEARAGADPPALPVGGRPPSNAGNRTDGPTAPAPSPSPPATAGGDLPPATAIPETMRVAQSLVNIRAAPATDATVVARIPKGTDVRVVSRSGAWLEVALGEGRSGFVRRDMLEAHQAAPK